LEDAESQVSSFLNREWKLKGLLPLRLDKDCCKFIERNGQWYIQIPLRPSPEVKTVRMLIPISIQPKRYYESLIKFVAHDTPPSKLIRKGKNLELHVTIPLGIIQNTVKPKAFCGIDLNMRKIAIIMLPEPNFSVHGRNVRFYSLKALNQRLNQIGGNKGESQKLIKNEFGNLLKTIFELTRGQQTTYVIEDLSGIRRNSKNMGRDVNRWLNSYWAYRKFRLMLEQKAKSRNELVLSIEPKGTSQTCYKCKVKGIRNKWKFTCPNCGNQINADLNAAINIALAGKTSCGLME